MSVNPQQMLDSRTGAYASKGVPVAEDTRGYYFPDAVVSPFVEQARLSTRPIFEAHVAGADFADLNTAGYGPRISFEESKALIIDAMEDFHPELGAKAREIFASGFNDAVQRNFIEERNQEITQDSSRWRLRQVAPGTAKIMGCTPAETAASELGPGNPNHQAVIQYEFDGTIGGVAFKMHEIGHAIADDYIREAGYKHGANPQHNDETQAYFVQNILYGYIAHHPERVSKSIADSSQRDFTAQVTRNLYDLSIYEGARDVQQGQDVREVLSQRLGLDWNKYDNTKDIVKAVQNQSHTDVDEELHRLHCRPMSMLTAFGLYKGVQAADPEQRRLIAETLLGRYGPKNIVEVFATAGIRDTHDMKQFADSIVDSVHDTVRMKVAYTTPETSALHAADWTPEVS